MFTFTSIFLLGWCTLLLIPIVTPDKFRRALRLLVAVAFFALMFCSADRLSAVERLIFGTVGLLIMLKSIILLRYSSADARSLDKVGLLLYMSLWPGMDPEPFRQPKRVIESGARFVKGFCFMLTGLASAFVLSACIDRVPPLAVPWLGILSLFLIIHFGYAEILTCFVRLAGFDVQPLFKDPLAATSLRDFWSKRWNLAFVEMNRILFLPGAKRVAGISGAAFLVFLLSGFFHELAISYASLSGWGGPIIYFAIQGIAFIIELKCMPAPRFPGRVQHAFDTGCCSDSRSSSSHFVLQGWWRRVWTFGCVLAPLPLLFTPVFNQVFIVSLFQSVHSLITAHSIRDWFSLALYCAAFGNFLTMAAGGQAPHRLGWREDFGKLRPFNRKIFWTYYAYTGMMIFLWGSLSLYLHTELLNGERAAICLAFAMGIFWGVRVIIDFALYKHDEWPAGADMVIGHTFLTTLFCALASTYLGLVIWHAL